MLGPEIELNIAIPEQSSASLSFAEATPTAVKSWTNDLPMANLGETARQLYNAIRELNAASMSPAERFQMLEIMRPAIHYICDGLSKHFSNRSITPKERQRKVINLVQTLRYQLATGYKVVLVKSIPRMGNELIRKNFAISAHRIITEYGMLILLCDQLYMVAPKNVWREMHEIYRFCDTLGLVRSSVRDDYFEVAKDSRISEAYRSNLLLACARPNQLRPYEINKAYQAFRLWAEYTEFSSSNLNDAVFYVNLSDDNPPRYKSLSHEPLNNHFYGFDTAELVNRLTNYLSETGNPGKSDLHLPFADQLSAPLLKHLSHAFGILTKRTFKRIASDGELEVSVGLSASHYHIAGGTTFHKLLMEQNVLEAERAELFQQAPGGDPWNQAFDASSQNTAAGPADVAINFTVESAKNPADEFPVFKVGLVNTSPGGYCIQWKDSLPENVQAGELLCIRELPDQTWRVAVLRWIRQSKQKGTQLGIELLAPNAQPVAVQQLNKTGSHSEFLRGLLLPELASISQPATLVTPRIPFQIGNKVMLRFNGMESKCILELSITETGSFGQFTLKGTNSFDSKSASITADKDNQFSKDDEFDSLWTDL